MIGGRSTKKNAVGEKTSSRSNTDLTDVKFRNAPIHAPKQTVTIDSGKYWKCVCSIKWIRRIPNAITHNTKKIDNELPFSASTAFGGEVLVVGEVVFGASVEMFLISIALARVTFMIADGVTFLSRPMEALTS